MSQTDASALSLFLVFNMADLEKRSFILSVWLLCSTGSDTLLGDHIGDDDDGSDGDGDDSLVLWNNLADCFGINPMNPGLCNTTLCQFSGGSGAETGLISLVTERPAYFQCSSFLGFLYHSLASQ